MLRRTSLIALVLVTLATATAPAAAQFRRQAIPSWWQRSMETTTRYYQIKTDLPIETARAYARHLDRMYEEYVRRLASLEPRAPEKLLVYVFAEREDYLSTLRMRFHRDGTGTGGMFFVGPEGSGLAFWTGDLPQRRIHHVIQHEGFHQFAWSRFGTDLPVWANEGLAELFGNAMLVDDTLILGQAPVREVRTMQNVIERERYIPFVELLMMRGPQWNERVRAGQADVMYLQSWSMVQFLVYGEDKRYQPFFEDYLRRLNKAIPPDRAWIDVFGNDIASFEQRWLAFAKAAKPSAFASAFERADFLAAGLLELSRHEVRPDSLEELRERLVQLGFQWSVERHGHEITFTANDAELFTIPDDDLSDETPTFVVARPKVNRSTKRARDLEQRHPTPSSLSTSGLEPREIEVEWIRDPKTGAWRYEVGVGRR